MKKNSGITLIALVITIIILIILAGISISATLGANGIITRATQGKENYEIAANEEQQMLANLDISMNETSTPTLAEQTTSENYGDYIDYGIDLNDDGNKTNDWKIFYKEGDDVFIIAADYLLASKLPTTCGFGNIGSNLDGSYPYRAYWGGTGGSVPSSLQETSQNTLFKATLYPLNNNNINSKCISTLLNTDNWTSFVDSTKADYAIGSPTVEMWCASWNEKGYTTITPTASSSDSGYKINGNTYVDGLPTSDHLYFPQTEIKSNCYGYWLASPSAMGGGNLVYVRYSGRESDDGYSLNGNCVRPLVHLKSGITAVKNETSGVWNLQ